MFNFNLGLSFSNLVFLKVLFVFSLSYFLDLVILVLQLKQKMEMLQPLEIILHLTH